MFTFTEQFAGRKVKGKCLALSRKDRHRRVCKRSVVRGSLTFAGHAGRNTVGFQGRLSRSHKLTPGRYALLPTATNAAGLHSKTQRLTFTILSSPASEQ